jgi:hypothetical protein
MVIGLLPFTSASPWLIPAGCILPVVGWLVVGGKDQIRDKYGSLEAWSVEPWNVESVQDL